MSTLGEHVDPLVAEKLLAHNIEYLTRVPARDEIPTGRVVVHNNVRPIRPLGRNGFRAWLSPPSDRLVVCDCDWAPELGTHYRQAH